MMPRNTTALKWQARDLVKSKGMKLFSYGRVAQYYALRLIDSGNSLRCLMDAHRFYPTGRLTDLFNKNRSLFQQKIENLLGHTTKADLDMVAMRSIVLKKPTVGSGKIEKGVLLITFTEAFPFYEQYVDCEQLLKIFYVVLEPSWAGYCNPNILFWMKYAQHPIVIQATEQKDYSFISSLRSNLVPVDFGASDWVDHRIFHSIPGAEKQFDVIYVCTYKPIKRHHALFNAIRKINDPSYKAALVCVSWGGTRSEIENLIDHYKIRDNITVYENCAPQRVNELLNRSKVNVLLSLKEGSNRSIFEGFFSNVPCIVLKNNIGINKNYINAMTGRLIEEKELKEALLYFRTRWHEYNPRDWALRNISPLVTTKKLSTCLQEVAQGRGEPWTYEIVPKVNSPEVQYFNLADKLTLPDSRTVISQFFKASEGEDRKGGSSFATTPVLSSSTHERMAR